jgi:hypothetical protein
MGKSLGRLSKGLAKATGHIAKGVWQRRREIGGSCRQIAVGAAGAAVAMTRISRDTVSFFIFSDAKIKLKGYQIKEQSEKYRSLIKNNEALFDSGIIGGVLVATMLDGTTKTPKDIQSAFEKVYPRLAEDHTFTEAVSQYATPEQLQGFLSSVKGKLFEMKYVEDLNAGKLPEGYRASLASSPTEAGWDIKIEGPNNDLRDLFQLKATDSLNYVKEAAEEYPDIDIVTTSELESQIMMNAADLGDVNTIISGIGNEDLAEAVRKAANKGVDSINYIPDIKFPAIALALIAFSAYSKNDVSISQKTYSFAQRGTKSVIAYFSGAIAAGATGIWWTAPFISTATRYLTEKGKRKREALSRLTRIYKKNNKIIKRYERLCQEPQRLRTVIAYPKRNH